MEKKLNNQRILLTGGHAAATAYALIQELKTRGCNDLYWIGAKMQFEGKRYSTLEHTFFPKIGIKTYSIIAGRIQRKFTFWTIPSLLKIPIGLFHSLSYIHAIRPKVVVSFGGFASFPVVISAWLMRIPVILHEQTSKIGRANQKSILFAKEIAISRKSSNKYFPQSKTVVVGNPVSKEVRELSKIIPRKAPVTLLITGGQRGAESINDIIGEALPELLGEFRVIHQTGNKQKEVFDKYRSNLPAELRKNYSVYGLISPLKWYQYLKKADIIISRSGANIVSEVIAARKPTIFIPLPISYLNEQLNNAEHAKKWGIFRILKQSDLNAESLMREISYFKRNWGKIRKKVMQIKSTDVNASKKLADLVFKYL